jgi:hypothetical protein
MTLATNTIDSSPSLPTLTAIQRRRRELLAFQAWQRPAQATAPPGEPLAAEESCLQEESCLAQEPEEPHPPKDPEPSPALLSQASAPRPPALADPALYGLAGLAVRSLSPHTEADRRLFFDACRDVLQHLRDVFAKLLQHAAAIGAARMLGHMQLSYAWKMLRQRTALLL